MEKNKGGRPKVVIDKDIFENLCKIQCTKDEVCSVLGGIDEKTLTRWCKEEYGEGFSDVYKKQSLVGKMSLRRLQLKLAEKNAAMAIFLGKQYLGQRDIVEVENKEVTKVEMLLKKMEDEANK
jgi:hypothetical protein